MFNPDEMKGQCAYYDDLFDEFFIKFAHTHFRDNYNWRYGNKSGNPGDNLFFFGKECADPSMIIDDDPVQIYIMKKIMRDLNIVILDPEDCYLNGQTFQLDGSIHLDRQLTPEVYKQNRFTVLYMVNHYFEDAIGNFEFSKNQIPFEPGRVVIFDALSPHRGLAPSIKNEMRITLTWKNCAIETLDNKS